MNNYTKKNDSMGSKIFSKFTKFGQALKNLMKFYIEFAKIIQIDQIIYNWTSFQELVKFAKIELFSKLSNFAKLNKISKIK